MNTSASNTSLPIGVRNNNPLNIRKSSNQWVGKISSDNAFEKFSDMKYGIRAGVKNLQTYYNRDGLKSVSKIINKWAPPLENHTDNYINYVATRMGVIKDSALAYNSDTFAMLVSYMSEMELGKNFAVSVQQVKEAINEFKLF